MSNQNCIILDVEATSRTPMTGVMTEFALAHLTSEATFYAHLYRAHPHPNNQAIPVVEIDSDGRPIEDAWFAVNGKFRKADGPSLPFPDLIAATEAWITETVGSARPVLVSDNPGYDAMWLNCFTDEHGGRVLCGHSSRRIGDFYAGTRNKWNDATSWKQLRNTPHTHNPVDDAVGNREALRAILAMSERQRNS